MVRQRILVWLCLSTLVGGLAACGDKPAEHEDLVLAYVNDRPVYQHQVDIAFERTLGPQGALLADDSTWDKVLESVVATRVLADLAAAQLSDGEHRELEARVQAWREEKLVRQYLADRVTPTPVTSAMVEDYYRRHPEQFGGGERLHYEQLSVAVAGDESLRDRAIAFLGEAADVTDWQALAQQARRGDLPATYQRGDVGQGVGEPALRARLQPMTEGQTSALAFSGGEASMLRLVRRETLAPRPLMEVSDDIRMRLAPVQLRKAVREVMDDAMQDANVRYLQEKD